MDILGKINPDAIVARHRDLQDKITRTPTVPLASQRLSQALGGAEIWLKLESLQHTGTFKARGALSNIRMLSDAARRSGVTAASAGNHAIASAWAAAEAGVSAKVVMQDTANPFRIAAARAFGAEVTLRPPGAETFAEAERLVQEEGRSFIHPFEGEGVALGTAGVGLEFVEDAPALDAIVIACGGGGLLSGAAAAIRQFSPATKVFGVEPQGADSMSRSLASGAPETLERTDTIADSLAPPMALAGGVALCRRYVSDMVRVSDDQICAGQLLLAEEAKQAVEPAAGAALAGALGPLRDRLAGRRVGVLICGANLDAATFAAQLERGAAHVPPLLTGGIV